MDKLSTKHFAFFILGSSLIAIKSYSSVFINLGGRDTYLLFAISALIFSFVFLSFLKLKLIWKNSIIYIYLWLFYNFSRVCFYIIKLYT